jgi:hypothetical protein
LLALLVASVDWASAGELRFGFERDEVDGPPAGFFFAKTGKGAEGRWRIVKSGEGHALAQSDRSRDTDRFALAIVKDQEFRDIKLSVKIKSVSGEREETGGVVWRYKDSENYLVARIDVRDNRVRLYRVVNGNLTRFGSEEDLNLKSDTWFTLRVEHKGDRIKVYLNDEAVIVERDRHFRDAGKVGLWTKADAETHFDDLQIHGLRDED